jgi:hypothetical protein
MLIQGTTEYGLPLNFSVLLAVTAVLTSIAARLYGRTARDLPLSFYAEDLGYS